LSVRFPVVSPLPPVAVRGNKTMDELYQKECGFVNSNNAVFLEIPAFFLCKTNKCSPALFLGKLGYTFAVGCGIIASAACRLCVNGPQAKRDNDVFVDCTDRRGETGPLPDGGRRLFFVAFLPKWLNFIAEKTRIFLHFEGEMKFWQIN